MKRFITLAITAVMIFGSVPVSTYAAVPFNDVPVNEWYYGHVQNAYEKGLIKGKTVDTFGPNDNLTHAEAVTLAANMNRAYTGDTIEKTSGAMWYQGSVNYCYNHDIINKEYDWNQPATRAVYMDIFSRALPATMLQEINRVDMGMIPDVPATNAYAQSIYSLYRAGIVRGTDDAYSCNPDSYVKRSEVAAILTRMMDATQRLNFTVADPNNMNGVVIPDFVVASTPGGDLLLSGDLKNKVTLKNVLTEYGKATAVYAKTTKGDVKTFTIHVATYESGKHNLGFIMDSKGKAYEIGVKVEKLTENSSWSGADTELVYEVMEEVNYIISQIMTMPGYVEDVEDERIIEFPYNGPVKKEEDKKAPVTDNRKEENKKEEVKQDDENKKWDMDDENIIVKTPVGKLYYPEMWHETLDIVVKESKDAYTVRYFETNGKNKVELFAISIGNNASGNLLGYYNDGDKEVGVYLQMTEIDEDMLTGFNPEKVYVMQEDVNYLLEKLFELRGFKAA